MNNFFIPRDCLPDITNEARCIINLDRIIYIYPFDNESKHQIKFFDNETSKISINYATKELRDADYNRLVAQLKDPPITFDTIVPEF